MDAFKHRRQEPTSEMATKPSPQWVYDVLNDLSIFAARNNFDITAQAIETAMERVRVDVEHTSNCSSSNQTIRQPTS